MAKGEVEYVPINPCGRCGHEKMFHYSDGCKVIVSMNMNVCPCEEWEAAPDAD